MTTLRTKQVAVVTSSTFAFTICFAVWMMFAVIGIPIKKALGLNETEFGLHIVEVLQREAGAAQTFEAADTPLAQ